MQNKLYRSRKFRVFGGVAGGLAEYFHLDIILVRVLFVIITFFSGLGVLFYIVLWIVIPEEPFEMAYSFKTPPDQGEKTDSAPGTENQSDNIFGTQDYSVPPAKNNSGRLTAGIILIAVGLMFLIDKIFPYFDFTDIFPVALVAIGAVLIWNSIRK